MLMCERNLLVSPKHNPHTSTFPWGNFCDTWSTKFWKFQRKNKGLCEPTTIFTKFSNYHGCSKVMNSWAQIITNKHPSVIARALWCLPFLILEPQAFDIIQIVFKTWKTQHIHIWWGDEKTWKMYVVSDATISSR